MSTGFYLLDNPNPHGIVNGDGQYHGYEKRTQAIRLIVMHVPVALQGLVGEDRTAEAVASYFANTDRPASAHVNIDRDSVVPLLPDDHVAFHVRNYNSPSLGIECGWDYDDWGKHPEADLQVIQRVAAWCAPRMEKYGIPPILLTKGQVDQGYQGFTAHSYLDPTRRKDPGPGFPWAILFAEIAKLRQETPTMFLPLEQAQNRTQDVACLAALMNAAYGLALDTSGAWTTALTAAIPTHLGATGSSKDGTFVTGQQWARLIVAVSRANGATGPTVDAELRKLYAGHKHPEGTTGVPRDIDQLTGG